MKYKQYDHPTGTIIIYDNGDVDYIPLLPDESDLDFDNTYHLDLLDEDEM